MKMNRKNINLAIVHTFFELYSVRQLAERVVNDLDDQDVGSVELHSSKTSGFTIRCKKDAEIDADLVCAIIADAMGDMLNDMEDEVIDYLADNYDIIYDPALVGKDLVKTVFDINRNGRLLVIEIDN